MPPDPNPPSPPDLSGSAVLAAYSALDAAPARNTFYEHTLVGEYCCALVAVAARRGRLPLAATWSPCLIGKELGLPDDHVVGYIAG